MCTVTFIPTHQGFYLTSSRDEKASRKTNPPATYGTKGNELVYPKDEHAGGTWIACNFKGRVACLLNGAFINHPKQSNYTKSRGLVVLDSFNYPNMAEFSSKIDLKGIEPFTLITLGYSQGLINEFFELRWDGEKKYLKHMDHFKHHIWSSATLYNLQAQKTRSMVFEQWVNKYNNFEDKKILDFHNRKHGLNAAEDIMMKGNEDLMTLSISQIHFQGNDSHFNYFDICNNKNYRLNLHSHALTHV